MAHETKQEMSINEIRKNEMIRCLGEEFRREYAQRLYSLEELWEMGYGDLTINEIIELFDEDEDANNW